MNKKINDIFEELTAVHEDLRAEVLVAELAKERSVAVADISVGLEGAFDRAYRKDVRTVQLHENEDSSDRLHLALSRNGMYDVLPEGIFHKEVQNPLMDFTTSRQLQKKEEKAARHLFSPLENEFFYQRVSMEQKSAAVIKNFGDLNDDFLIDLWKIDRKIPKKYSVRLVKLLPYAHKIAGDLDMTFQCLEKILETKVTFKKQFKKRLVHMEQPLENRLGLDFVLHQEQLEIQQPVLQIILQPLDTAVVDDFLGDKGFRSFLQVYYQYFIPIEYEVNTQIEMHQNDAFVLGAKEGTYMGMTTRL